MKLSSILVVFILSMTIVRGAWWVPILKPVVVGFGAALAVINIDIAPILDIQLFEKKEEKS